MMTRISWLSLLFLSHCVVPTRARTWHTIVDPSLYIAMDPSELQLKIELDPFYYPGEKVLEPTASPINHKWITFSPTMTPTTPQPSMVPSDLPSLAPSELGPTMEPSAREDNIEGNGGCREGSSLYQVNMYDSFGDGWSSDTMIKVTSMYDADGIDMPPSTITKTTTTNEGNTTITVSQTIQVSPKNGLADDSGAEVHNPLGLLFLGGLRQGQYGHGDICLKPRRCYSVEVSGGDWLEEVSWDIRPVRLGSSEKLPPLVEGGAPLYCTFSVPDENDMYFCVPSCSETVPEEAAALSDLPFDVEKEEEVLDETEDAADEPEPISETSEAQQVSGPTELTSYLRTYQKNHGG